MKIEWQEAHPKNYRKGRAAKIDRVIIHVAEGTYGGTLSWFKNPQAGVSAHYTVAADGRVGQSVREEDTAWHAGPVPDGQPDMNLRSIGIEHEGKQNPANPWQPTAAQLDATARLVAEICKRHTIPADRQHIIGHNEVFPGRAARANCPGKGWPWEEFLARVSQYLLVYPVPGQQPKPGSAVRLFDPQTNTQIGTGTLVEDKVYIPPAILKQLRDQ
ncbi:N-acetylmuramoyl-L-alanine amidase [Deinococcus navajonensis]|uniref:N-acetylmuramoyl-L-alanine amidase n=1 Tax=Deinococcus navajonensis TaxID=309884 RepID=A0ABV8XPQ3_9DEIO